MILGVSDCVSDELEVSEPFRFEMEYKIVDGLMDPLLVAAPVKLALKVPVADAVGDELIELVWLDSEL